jgi:putative hydrolase of the HAD superfamily
MLRAVIFDMDDTLVDWSQNPVDWEEVRRNHWKPVYDDLRAAGYTLPELNAIVELYNEHNRRAWAAAAPPDWIAPRQIDVLRDTLFALPIEKNGLDLERLQRIFGWGAIPGVRLFPDTLDVLHAVRAAGLSTGLLTNASSPMWMRDRELDALGLTHLLDARLTAGDVGHLKPHVRPFAAILERLEVEPEEAIFVGDRVYDDVVGAQSAGIRAVWIRRDPAATADSVRPNAIIDSLTALLPTLDMWFPGWR